MRWSDLASNPTRLKVELARDRTTPADLARDVQDVPALRDECARLEDDYDGLLFLALQWFGDEGHPQPTERRDWPVDEWRIR